MENKNMEDNKTYEQYENDYENIKLNEMKQQSYINDLLHECYQLPYNIDKINILLKLVDINAPTSSGRYVINGAILSKDFSSSGHVELVKYLINNGANISYINNIAEYALQKLSQSGNDELLLYLIDLGINFKQFKCCLYYAASCKNMKVLTYFTDYIPLTSLNYTDSDKINVLHRASIFGNIEMVKILLTHNIDINAQTKTYETALYLAVLNNQIEVVKELIKHSADVNLCSIFGSPIDIAKNNIIKEYLFVHGAKPSKTCIIF